MSSSADATAVPNPIVRLLLAIRSSFVLFTVALGVVLVALGLLVSGQIAGILTVLGLSAVLYGVVGELALRATGYK